MHGLQTAHAPSSKIVIPHFIAGGIAFLVAALLMLFSPEAFLSSYHHNKLIAITHIILLGWGGMMIFGALYQLIPVVYETSLFSEKLAVVTFWLFAISVPFLSYSFWVGSYAQLLFYASIVMFISLLMFIVNLLMTYRQSKKRNIQSRFITTAVFWLAATELMGLILALNFRLTFLSEVHLHYLKIHAHLGLVGWFLLLIMGAASLLIPMFMVSHARDERKLHYAYYLVNAGLLYMSIDWLWIHGKYAVYVSAFTIALGVYFFLSQEFIAYKNRLRKELDKGLQYTRNSMFALIPGVLLGLALSFSNDSPGWEQWISLYGFVLFFGVISMLILGQTYKTLPFIVWLDKYQPYVGKYKTPLPRELYDERITRFQYSIYSLALSLFPLGIIFRRYSLLIIGAALLMLTAVLHFYNLMKIILHKTKLKEFSKDR